MRRLVAAFLFLSAASAFGQTPPPPLPPINPALARLDQTVGGLPGPAFCLAVNEAGGMLAAGCERGKVVFWGKAVSLGVRVGDGTPNVLDAHKGPVLALAWGGCAVLASAGADQKVILWEMPEGKATQTLTPGGGVRALAMSADGKTLAAGGDEAFVQLYEVAGGKPGAKLMGHKDWVRALAFRPDNLQLASAGNDGKVILWDVAGGKQAAEFGSEPPLPPNAPPRPARAVHALAFSPDGKLLAVGGGDGPIHLINPADGKVVRSLPGHAGAVTALAFHPAGAVLASAGKDGKVILWDAVGGKVIKPLDGHTAWVEGVAFFAQGTRLASVGADATLRLWDLTEPAKK
jgi:WD40 repeat protein